MSVCHSSNVHMRMNCRENENGISILVLGVSKRLAYVSNRFLQKFKIILRETRSASFSPAWHPFDNFDVIYNTRN